MKSRNQNSLWKQVWLLAAKDLKIFLLDRGALLFALVFPFAFVLMFQLVMGPSMIGGDDKPLTVYVASAEPAGSLSRQIIDAMVQEGGAGSPATGSSAAGSPAAGSSDLLPAGGLVIEEFEPSEARTQLEAEKIGAYLLFPEGFSDAVLAGEPATVSVYYIPGGTTNRAATVSVAQAIADDCRYYGVLYSAVAELAGSSSVPAWPSAGGLAPAPGPSLGEQGLSVDLRVEKVGDIAPPRAVDLLIPGYLTMFVFFALALTAETLVGEKENQTLERLMAGSASRLSIVSGKIAGSFARGLVQVAVFWIAGILIFHVRMGNAPWATVLISILLTLAASGIGVFLATVAKSRSGASGVAVFVSLAFAALGGSWWPLFVMPPWMQTLAKITPHGWANGAFNKLMLFGASPANVLPEMIALAAFAVVFGGLAVWRFTSTE